MTGQAYWSLPERGSREDRALMWLASVESPRGIVVPPALWKATARVSGLKVHQVKRLARRAAAAGDSRVAWYTEHLARLGRRTPRGPTELVRARMANWLRERGLPWKRIAHVLGYSEKGSGAEARKAAALYRERLANGGTLSPSPGAAYAAKREMCEMGAGTSPHRICRANSLMTRAFCEPCRGMHRIQTRTLGAVACVSLAHPRIGPLEHRRAPIGPA